LIALSIRVDHIGAFILRSLSFNWPDIDRLLAVREKIFSDMFSGFFYSVETRGLSLTEFKAMALRLYVEMAFIRAYLIENSPALWPQKSEDLWTHHTPKALRKLNPAFYGQLLGKFQNKSRLPA